MKHAIFLSIFLIVSCAVLAQETIKGIVTDGKEPVPGVNVTVVFHETNNSFSVFVPINTDI